MIGILAFTLILACAVHESQGQGQPSLWVDTDCNENGILITVNLPDFFASTNTGPCVVSDEAISMPGPGGTFQLFIPCTVQLNNPLAFFVHPQGMVMGKHYVGFTCKPDTMATLYVTNQDIRTPDYFDHTPMDILDAQVILAGLSTSYTLDYEDTISVTASFADPLQNNYYDLAVQMITIINGGVAKDVVVDGCAEIPGVTISPVSGDNVDIEFPVLVPVDSSNGVFSPITIDIFIKFYICLDGDASCGTCVPTGRKRRQVDDQIPGQEIREANATSRTMVFLDKDDQDKFINKMMTAYAAGEPLRRIENSFVQQSVDDICMNKTVTSIIVVLMLIGMVLCFLATIWMCFRLKKSRRSDESVKSDYAYSNRTFSKALESVKPVV